MGVVSGGGVHSTDSIAVAAWPIWVISIVVSFEIITLTTVTRVGCFVVYRHANMYVCICINCKSMYGHQNILVVDRPASNVIQKETLAGSGKTVLTNFDSS